MVGLARRLHNRVQLTTDGLESDVEAVSCAFGRDGIDRAQLVKDFSEGEHRYEVVFGNPDPAYISASLVERQNLICG